MRSLNIIFFLLSLLFVWCASASAQTYQTIKERERYTLAPHNVRVMVFASHRRRPKETLQQAAQTQLDVKVPGARLLHAKGHLAFYTAGWSPMHRRLGGVKVRAIVQNQRTEEYAILTGEVRVLWDHQASTSEAKELANSYGVKLVRHFRNLSVSFFEVPETIDFDSTLAQMEKDQRVQTAYAEILDQVQAIH